LRATLNLVEVAVDPEGSIEERRLSVAMNHDASPPSLVPAIATLPANKGLAAEDLVFCALDGLDDLGLAIAADSCDGEGIWDDVGVRLEDKANLLCALVDGEGEIEFRVSMNSV
jgi:hypothetical protein